MQQHPQTQTTEETFDVRACAVTSGQHSVLVRLTLWWQQGRISRAGGQGHAVISRPDVMAPLPTADPQESRNVGPPPPPPATVNSTGNSPSPGRPTPGVVKQDKSSGASVDTTKTRSGPQRVRRSSGERPIGAAKGKHPYTKALCHPPPPPRIPAMIT